MVFVNNLGTLRGRAKAEAVSNTGQLNKVQPVLVSYM